MDSERAKMIAGEPYDASSGALVEARARARELCATLNATFDERDPERPRLIGELFARVGRGVMIEPPFRCEYGFNIELGDRVFFNFGCMVLDVCRVRIGSHTMLGPGVQILTPMHPLDAVERRGKEFGRPVTIGSDVWIGGGAIVLPGVTVGDRSVIGAGSVVTRDVPAGVLAVGNPCRVVRALESKGPGPGSMGDEARS